MPHCMEEFHLQLEELLVEVWPVLPAQQELEDAPLGHGVVFLHVGGNVATTRKEGRLDLAPRGPPASGQGGQWGGCRGHPQEPVSRREYPGLGARGAPLAGAPECRQHSALSLSGPGHDSACRHSPGAFHLGSFSLRAARGVSWLHSLPQDLTDCLPLL